MSSEERPIVKLLPPNGLPISGRPEAGPLHRLVSGIIPLRGRTGESYLEGGSHSGVTR